MSAFFGPRNFEDRIELAFRGSAKEQRKAQKEFGVKRRAALPFSTSGFQQFIDRRSKETLGRPNIFKANLGGTGRLTG